MPQFRAPSIIHLKMLDKKCTKYGSLRGEQSPKGKKRSRIKKEIKFYSNSACHYKRAFSTYTNRTLLTHGPKANILKQKEDNISLTGLSK